LGQSGVYRPAGAGQINKGLSDTGADKKKQERDGQSQYPHKPCVWLSLALNNKEFQILYLQGPGTGRNRINGMALLFFIIHISIMHKPDDPTSQKNLFFDTTLLAIIA
jgi:hypothetical protein